MLDLLTTCCENRLFFLQQNLS